ncbi:hypothetical protein EV1_033666 [Malus domestica]
MDLDGGRGGSGIENLVPGTQTMNGWHEENGNGNRDVDKHLARINYLEKNWLLPPQPDVDVPAVPAAVLLQKKKEEMEV